MFLKKFQKMKKIIAESKSKRDLLKKAPHGFCLRGVI